MASVAFLGLGVMGRGMAARLVEKHVPITIWNRHRERAEALVASASSTNARVVATPREAASQADLVMSMVADDAASKAVWLGNEGVLADVRPGTVLVESSTVSPAWIEELAKHVSERRCMLLDAPVTGSRPQAESGQLLFLVGGSAEALSRAQPVFSLMSRGVVHVGPTGSGARLKLVNNFLCGVQAAALGEAIALIERAGLDREVATGVLTNGAPGSPLVKSVSSRMTKADYDTHFGLDLMRKDLSYALAEAERWGLSLLTAAAARKRFAEASAAGLGSADFSAVVDPIRKASK